jgi:Na+-transporting NADH:ubiquinone oxidoreductase subunit C
MEEKREEGMIKKRLFSVIYMFLLTFFFTAVVSGIHEINKERIAINEEIKLQKIVLEVLGIEPEAGTTDIRVREIFEGQVRVQEGEERVLYRGFAGDGKTLMGYAFPLVGPGFWGPIYGVMAVDPELERVIGVAFYRHSETPGLGGRISEDWFREQFKGRRLLTVGKSGRYFYLRPPGTARAANEVDAITGATGTSRAVERLIDRSLRNYLYWITEQRAKGRM